MDPKQVYRNEQVFVWLSDMVRREYHRLRAMTNR